jgi:hypothetical protein
MIGLAGRNALRLKEVEMLRIVMLLIGAAVMAPVAIAAFFMALPALPFLVAGFVLVKLVQSRTRRRWSRTSWPAEAASVSWSDSESHGFRGAALLLLIGLVALMAMQIKLWGFSWRVESGLAVVTVLIAGLWWVNYRLDKRNRSRGGRTDGVGPHDLYRLLEIERASGVEERQVLILREFNRLTQAALRPDPALPSSWPSVAELRAVRDQVRLLRSSALDPASRPSIDTGEVDRPELTPLVDGIGVLEEYVNLLLRARLLGRGNLEMLRVLVRDQSRLRAMQDDFVSQLQNRAPVAVAG